MEEEFKKCFRWKADNMPNTTEAIVVISKTGVVKKLEHKCWNSKNNNYNVYKENIYNISENRGNQRYDSIIKKEKHGGYQHVGINGKNYSIHRLVAKAFVPNPDNLPQINHIDGVRNNNIASNLEWCTNSENQKHAVKNNLKKIGKFVTLSDKDKFKIIELRMRYYTSQQISKKVNISHETIRNFFNKFVSDETNIRKKIKSFSKLISNKFSGISERKNSIYKFIFKHSNYRYATFKTKEEAFLFKNEYINNNFDNNSGIIERWNNEKNSICN